MRRLLLLLLTAGDVGSTQQRGNQRVRAAWLALLLPLACHIHGMRQPLTLLPADTRWHLRGHASTAKKGSIPLRCRWLLLRLLLLQAWYVCHGQLLWLWVHNCCKQTASCHTSTPLSLNHRWVLLLTLPHTKTPPACCCVHDVHACSSPHSSSYSWAGPHLCACCVGHQLGQLGDALLPKGVQGSTVARLR